ncbi:MAG: mechanosensitive ion channel protein MscS [Methanosarcina sp. 795]|uniref:mechanosensitive ion channel family protein n=1 Tax=Methanosarcina thermophila TaxID=2210 RepID=UPI00064FC680|nr:mechanosensitive ion channel family protein [Methanosarcina thermophila]ALK06056.1 MAG: mechanosensitive ion channel protein MscS [Methanosarcina sp. 795]NLU57050.1 mechanosensitive ion channel family protein [Methanosarcina thermophila]HOA69399.1 mechanosensitive ion channel family protein [Methanosarcina thermophila]HOQ65547.1 mechanosensitive ion channel family protein [Methanosarcina thermophila]HPT81134.1 mechanosensitive ion channel family protein [Methanosarcina thermophila]
MGLLITDFDFLDIRLPISNGNVTLGSVLKFILILSFSILIAKVLSLYLRRSLKDRVSKDVCETIVKIFYYGTITIVFLSNLSLIGISPSALLVAGGVTGIILGFASQNIVGNLISGFFLMVERPIKIGDQVEISGISGFVTDIRIISTIIRTYDGLLVRLPNQQVFTTNITNIVGHPVRRFEYTIRIRYSDDADAAIFLIKDLIDKEPFALLNPSPSVFVSDLGDSWVNLTVRIWAPVSEWFGIKTRVLWNIKKTLEENGIEIPLPQRIVRIQSDPKKVPEELTLPVSPEKEIESVINYEERVFA